LPQQLPRRECDLRAVAAFLRDHSKEPHMTHLPLQRLSNLVDHAKAQLTRRRFLAGIPVFAAAASACGRKDDEQSTQRPAASNTSQDVGGANNSNSRLDTAIAAQHPAATSAAASAAAPYRVYDAVLRPAPDTRTHRIHWRAQEVPLRIGPDRVIAAWTFEGDVPGPVLRVRQGDTVEFTLTNEGNLPHSMDFHAAQVDPKTAFRSVAKGQSVSFSFKPRHAGAFMYHCGTGPC
jgi:nitrite reductase (NO-forming)